MSLTSLSPVAPLPSSLEKRTTWLARTVLAILQLASLAAFGAPVAAIDGFSLDDSWIHQVVARTFAATGTLGYSQGHHGAAATSYLWAILLSGNFRFFRCNPVYYTLAINAACTLGAGQLLFLLVDGGDIFELPSSGLQSLRSYRSVFVTALACFGGNFLWVAFSGMEQMLLVFASLGGIYFLVQTSPRGPWLAGCFAAIMAITRPEAILFGPFLIGASVLFQRRATTLKRLGLLAIPWGLAVLAYVGSNKLATGTAMPATLAGRKWLWLGLDAWQSKPQIELAFVEAWIMRLREYTLGTSSMVALWISFGIAVFGALRVLRSTNLGLKLTYAWGFLHSFTYAVMLPSPGQGGRYQIFVPLLYLLSLAIGSVALVRDACVFWPRAPRIIAWIGVPAALAAWTGLVAVGVRDWSHDHAKAVSHVRATEIGLGALIDALPPTARVASFDIGGSGYAAHRPIIDIGGLVEAKSAEAMMHGDTWKYMRDNAVDYVVLSLPYNEAVAEPINIGYRLRMLNNPAIRLTELRELRSPPEVWLPSVKSTWNTAARQVLYRVEYTGKPGPSPLLPAAPGNEMDSDGSLLNAHDRARVNYGVGLLAAYDVNVRVRAKKIDAGDLKASGWVVDFGPWGARVAVPSDMPESARGRVMEAIIPYVKLHDYNGAALASLHAILAAVQASKDPTVSPILPPLSPPTWGGLRNDVESTALWGLLIMVLLTGASIAVERMAKATTGGGLEPQT